MDNKDGSLEMLYYLGSIGEALQVVHEEGLVDDACHLIRLEDLKISY